MFFIILPNSTSILIKHYISSYENLALRRFKLETVLKHRKYNQKLLNDLHWVSCCTKLQMESYSWQPSLVRCSISRRKSRTLQPKKHLKGLYLQHVSRHLHHNPILPLDNSIFLRSVRRCQLPMDVMLFAKMVEVVGQEFSTTIATKRFDEHATLLFHLRFEVLELLKSLRFVF